MRPHRFVNRRTADFVMSPGQPAGNGWIRLRDADGLIPLEIDRPYVIGRLGTQPIDGHGQDPEPLALARLARNPEAFLAPQPLRALAVQLPALIKQQLMRPTVPPPRTPTGDHSQLRPEHLIISSHDRLMTLGRAMLPDISARPPPQC